MRSYSASGSGRSGYYLMAYTGLALSLAALVFVAALSTDLSREIAARRTTSTTTLGPVSVSGPLITPPLSLAQDPPILTDQPFGDRLTDINLPMNSSQLAVINGGPDSYYDSAAQMWLNGSLTSLVGQELAYSPLLKVNGKPAITYLGAISCVYCGENRWAMALALSRFGTFQDLFLGYSSLGDQDVPTIYWAPAYYNSTSAVEFGNFYNSTYISFISIEYSSLITAGFQMETLPYFQQQAAATGNAVYEAATNLIVNLNNFDGTPYTIWGNYAVLGADATDFGDSTSTATTSSSTVSSTASSTTLALTSMTHDQVLASLADPTTSFAWTEYAAADYYIALICSSIGAVSSSSTTAPAVCSIPSISSMSAVVHEGAVNVAG